MMIHASHFQTAPEAELEFTYIIAELLVSSSTLTIREKRREGAFMSADFDAHPLLLFKVSETFGTHTGGILWE